MFYIIAHVPVTRRLRVNYVLGAEGTLAFTSSKLLDAVKWVQAQDQNVVQVYDAAPPEVYQADPATRPIQITLDIYTGRRP